MRVIFFCLRYDYGDSIDRMPWRYNDASKRPFKLSEIGDQVPVKTDEVTATKEKGETSKIGDQLIVETNQVTTTKKKGETSKIGNQVIVETNQVTATKEKDEMLCKTCNKQLTYRDCKRCKSCAYLHFFDLQRISTEKQFDLDKNNEKDRLILLSSSIKAIKKEIKDNHGLDLNSTDSTTDDSSSDKEKDPDYVQGFKRLTPLAKRKYKQEKRHKKVEELKCSTPLPKRKNKQERIDKRDSNSESILSSLASSGNDSMAPSVSDSSDEEEKRKKMKKMKKMKKKESAKKMKNNKKIRQESSDESSTTSSDSSCRKKKKKLKKKKMHEFGFSHKESKDKTKKKYKAKKTHNKDNIVEIFGMKEPLLKRNNYYKYHCPYQRCSYLGKDLKRHFILRHKWDSVRARKEVSCRLKVFKYASKTSKTGVYKPRVCKQCNICVERIKKHIKHVHRTKKGHHLNNDEIRQFWKYRTEEPTIFRNNNTETSESDVETSITSSVTSRKTLRVTERDGALMSNSIFLTEVNKKELGIVKERFKRTYRNVDDFVSDFQKWLEISNASSKKSAKQISSNLKEIWSKLDSKCTIIPNKLASHEDLEDLYFLPLYMELKQNIRSTDNSKKFLKASTIMGKLGSLRQLIRFLKSREVFLGIHYHELDSLEAKLIELNNRLKPYHKAREHFMRDYKTNRFIKPNDMLVYGASKKIREIVKMLEDIDDENQSQYSQRDAVAARNHLMVIICFGNAARASNLINMKLEDVEQALYEEELDAYVVTSNNYKTSFLYGEKKILFGRDIYFQLKRFIKYLRPKICSTTNSNEVFISVRADGPMSHSSISNGLTSIFQMVDELKGEKIFARVSPTKIRHSVATQLAGVGDEDLETLAKQFMKNRPSTTSKYYVQVWAQREASRLSMKCYGEFNLMSNFLEKAKVPSAEKLKEWISSQKLKIKKDFGNSIEDEDLVTYIDEQSYQTDDEIFTMDIVSEDQDDQIGIENAVTDGLHVNEEVQGVFSNTVLKNRTDFCVTGSKNVPHPSDSEYSIPCGQKEISDAQDGSESEPENDAGNEDIFNNDNESVIQSGQVQSKKDSREVWYKPRSGLSKEQVYAIVYLGRNGIMKNEISKSEFHAQKNTVHPSLLKYIDILSWEKIRMVLKAMARKYSKETEHTRFSKFLAEAREMSRKFYEN